MSDSTSSVTTFEEMYDFFLAGITDDMFMEMTLEDTTELLEEILLAAIPHFEFPRKNIFDLDLEEKIDDSKEFKPLSELLSKNIK